MQKLEFNLSEIDTKGVDAFIQACAKGQFGGAASIAQIILDNSKSEEVKIQIRDRFTKFTATKFSYLLSGGEELNKIHSNLLCVYLNRASKKLNISKDIPAFSEIAERYVAEDKTLLHFDRLYTLYQAVMNTLNMPGDIVELGVYRGGSLKFIREIVSRSNVPTKQIVGFDTFAGHIDTKRKDGGAHKVGMFSQTSKNAVEEYINDSSVLLIEGDASVTFKQYSKNCSGISFAHLDMDLYQPTADTLPLVFDLLAPGGVILLDDYGFTSCPGVKVAVDAFLDGKNMTSFHLMTGQMLLVKR